CSPATTNAPMPPQACSTQTATTVPATSWRRLVPTSSSTLTRRDDVLELAQAEFVALSSFEPTFGDSTRIVGCSFGGQQRQPGRRCGGRTCAKQLKTRCGTRGEDEKRGSTARDSRRRLGRDVH